MSERKIIHIDMDAFYAAVEQRDDARLRGRPVVVGGGPAARGVVAAASYEARRFGIHSAMPAARAYRLCPHAVFLRPRFAVYRAVSREIHGVFREFTELVEPLSLDEAYLDVTLMAARAGSATAVARAIKARILERTGLVASAGVSYNKFLAKLASDWDKPDGLYVIPPARGEDFVAGLPVARFHGVGPATAKRMQELGIHTGADLRQHSLAELTRIFGKVGAHYYRLARGIDERPVESHRERKSLSAETTFAEDLRSREALLAALAPLTTEVAEQLIRRGLRGRTLTLKLRYDNFELITRSLTRAEPFYTAAGMQAVLPQLLDRTEAGRRAVRLLGVGVSNFAGAEPRQLSLFPQHLP